MSFRKTIISIQEIVQALIKSGLSDDQNFPSTDSSGVCNTIGFNNDSYISLCLSPLDYKEVYTELDDKRAFTTKLLDGSLIQMSYTFDKKSDLPKSHRLAFLPNLNLISWEQDQEVYTHESFFNDIISKTSTLGPFRFDYNQLEVAAEHPKSHLTLFNAKDCRIPISHPVTPGEFIEFVIFNFYRSAYDSIEKKTFKPSFSTDNCFVTNDKNRFHIYSPII